MTLTLILSHAAAFAAGMIAAPVLAWAIGAVFLGLLSPDDEVDDGYEPYDL